MKHGRVDTRNFICLLSLFLAAAGALGAQGVENSSGHPLILIVEPSGIFPVGDSWTWFNPGTSLRFVGGNPLGDSPWMSKVGLDLAGVPDRAGTLVYFFTYLMGLDLSWPVSDQSALGLNVAAGPSWGTLASFRTYSIVPYGEAGVHWTSHLAPTLDFRLGTSYKLWWGTLQAVSAMAAFDVWLGGDR